MLTWRQPFIGCPVFPGPFGERGLVLCKAILCLKSHTPNPLNLPWLCPHPNNTHYSNRGMCHFQARVCRFITSLLHNPTKWLSAFVLSANEAIETLDARKNQPGGTHLATPGARIRIEAFKFQGFIRSTTDCYESVALNKTLDLA